MTTESHSHTDAEEPELFETPDQVLEHIWNALNAEGQAPPFVDEQAHTALRRFVKEQDGAYTYTRDISSWATTVRRYAFEPIAFSDGAATYNGSDPTVHAYVALLNLGHIDAAHQLLALNGIILADVPHSNTTHQRPLTLPSPNREQTILNYIEHTLARTARDSRDAAIVDARERGMSKYAIAKTLGLSATAIAKIVGKD